MASTSRASARRTASCTASPATRPACSGSRERGAVPNNGSGERGAVPSTAPEGPAPCSPLPRKTRSASSGPRASAFWITSGPIPRGSPNVTASRGRRLETDVDVRGAPQQVEMVLDGELLTQPVANMILHFVKPQLPFGKTLQQLEHHKPRPRRPDTHLEHRLQPGARVFPDGLFVIGRELGDGEGIGELGLARLGVAPGKGVERRSVGERVVHRIGLTPRAGDLRRGNGRLNQDVAR